MAWLEYFSTLVRRMNEAQLQVFFFSGLILIAAGMIATVVLAFRASRAWGLFSLTGVGGGIFLVRRPKTAALAWALLILGLVIMGAPMLMTHLATPDRGAITTTEAGAKHVTLTNWGETKEKYQELLKDEKITVLQMANNDVSDDVVALLKDHPTIEELDLSNSVISDACLPTLAALPKLAVLRLKGTRISDAGFRQHLLPLPTLKRLDVTGTEIKSATIADWKAAGEGRRALQ